MGILAVVIKSYRKILTEDWESVISSSTVQIEEVTITKSFAGEKKGKERCELRKMGAGDEDLMNFMAITEETDVKVANQYFEASGYNLSDAVALYFASNGGSGGGGGGGTSSSGAGQGFDSQHGSQSQPYEDFYDEEQIRKPDEIKRSRLIDDQELQFVGKWC